MPSDKRARQRASRSARMAQLQQAQQRKRNTRRGLVVGAIVLIAVVLALVTGGVFSSGSKKKVVAGATTTVAGATTTLSGTTTTTTPSTSTTVAAASVAPLATTALEADLIARPAPALSADCDVAASAPSTVATVPAKGNAVAIIHAPTTVPFPKLDGSSPHYTKFSSAPPFCIDATKTYTATMTTDVGVITIALLPKYAPVTVNNFVFLAGYHYFDGTVFHRVIPGFVDQGGDPTGTGSGGPGYSFKDELPKTKAAYDSGSVAMANSGANTNGSQFFLVIDNGGQELTPAYAVYGQITGGLSVAEKINADGNANTSDSGVPPAVLHRIISVTIAQS